MSSDRGIPQGGDTTRGYAALLSHLLEHPSRGNIVTQTTSDRTPSPQFKAMVSSFFGSAAGNIRSPVWICGLEPGGGYSPDIPIPVSNLAPYSFEDLQCWTADDFFGSFWGDSSPLCWAVAKILVGLKDGRYDSTRFRNRETLRKTLAADNLVGPNGLALVLNAFPISMQGVN